MDDKGAKVLKNKAYKLIIPYLYIKGSNGSQKTLEMLRYQVKLGNEGNDDDNSTDNKRNNLGCAHTTENKNKK